MNYSGKIIAVAAAVAMFAVNASAQEPVEEQTAEEGVNEELFDNATMLDPNATPQRYYVRKVNIHGVQYLNHDIIKSASGLVPGDSIYIPSNFINSAMAGLWNQRQFADIKIGAVLDGDNVDLEVYLKQRPRVNNWAFTGVSKTRRNDLLEKLKLKRGRLELSDYLIDKNKKLITQYLVDKGFRNAEVNVRIDNDTTLKQAVNVTFDVDQNERVRIGKITFEGNEHFVDKRLRKTLKKTHQRGINLLRSTKLNEKDYEDDKELLIDFYNSKGYRNATIISDSIYQINPKRIGIVINVEEGDKYYIRNISWVGNSIYNTQYLENMFGVAKGDTYDKRSMYKRLGIGKEANPNDASITSQYKNGGYLMAQIDPAETIIGTDSIDLEIKIFEGKQFTINEVGISGNVRVDDEVIRRELYTRPGELYDQSMLMQTMSTLNAMGHFNAESILPDIRPLPNSNDLVDINWPLEETASDQFNVAGGWGSGTFVGSVGITLNNLSIKNFFKKGAWRPYPMGQNQRLSISAQTNGTYYKAFALSFTDPWLGGHKPTSFTIGAHYSESNNAYYVWQTSTQYFRSYGIQAGLGKRLSWPDPFFSIYAEASYERYALKDWRSFIMENGTANLLSLKLAFGRNSVDQPIYPRSGSDISLSVQVTPPYSLWDGKDYANKAMSDEERYKWIEFHKWQFKAQWFQSLTRDQKLVIMAKAEMGYLGNYNKNKVSPFERFDVGGDGMTGYNMYGIDIISMRGYEDGALNPIGENYACAYNKYTLELRYPIILKPSSQIYVLGFLEGGNAFTSWRTFSPFRIKRSAGVGVRLYLPVVGMLGIDWGYGFDPPAGQSTRSGSQIHFVMGGQF